jgi:hypothetical protein
MGGVRVLGLSCPHSGTTPLRVGQGLPVREDLSGDLPVQAGASAIRRHGAGAQVAAVVGAEVVAAGGGCLRRRDRRRQLRLDPCSLALMACPRPSSGDAGEGLVTAASALRSSLLLFSHPKRGSLSLLSEWLPVSRLEFVIPRAPWYGGCSYPREQNRSPVCYGTLSASVCSLWLSRPEHLGIRERSCVSSSFRALGLVCWLAEPLNRASVAFHGR